MSDYQGTERLGLYIMIIIIMITTCSVENKTDRIKSKVDHIQRQIESIKQP
jgi:uncharacterized protein YoxC